MSEQKSDNWVYQLGAALGGTKKYSQYGEELIISEIFRNIGVKSKYFVDFGAGDGLHLSNTRHLLEDGWNGLMMDGDPKGSTIVHEEFITRDNIEQLFEKYRVPSCFDLLSIDMDGNDYWVLERILDIYSPRVIVAEFNGTIPYGVDKVMKYNYLHQWNNDDYYGASFTALKRLGEQHGYVTIYQLATTNIFMVHKSELANPSTDFNVTYQAVQYHPHNPTGEWIIR